MTGEVLGGTLIDTSTCETCGAPFVEVGPQVVRARGHERVAMLRCANRHESVMTTTLVTSYRARTPPPTQTGEQADRLVAHLTAHAAEQDARRAGLVDA